MNTITSNVDVARIMNDALQGASLAHNVEKPNVTFVGNDKGLSMMFVDGAGQEQVVEFGGVKLDVPNVHDSAERADALIKALDGLGTEDRDAEEVQEAKDAVRSLLTSTNAAVGGSTVSVGAIDLYQIMALLVKAMQKQRDAASTMRIAANEQAISAINNQIGQMKDAAMWGFIGSFTCSVIQLGMSIYSMASAGSQIKEANRCETAGGLKLAQKNLATAKLVDNPAKAAKNATKLGKQLYKADRMAFGEVDDALAGRGVEHPTPDTVEAKLARLNTLAGKYEGQSKAALEAYNRDPSSKNFKALETAQKRQAYVFAKQTELKAGMLKGSADKEVAVKEWKTQAGDARLAAHKALQNDPEYQAIQKRLNFAQIVEGVARPLGDLGKASFEYVAKQKEADAKHNEIDQRLADRMFDNMTDLYKEAKQLMDDVRNLLLAKTQSEIETQRKIMV